MSSKFLPLIEAAQALPPTQQRAVAAILGACVADAAARPLHWVYSQTDLQRHIKDRVDRPEFMPQSHSPFYSLPTGENSCYFDITHSVLDAMGGDYDYEGITRQLAQDFGPGTRYDMAKREEYMQLRREGRIDGPIEGKWLHGALIQFMANKSSGQAQPWGDKSIKETDGFCAALPVVLKYAGTEGVHARVEAMIRTLSNWPTAVSHGLVAARIVEQFVLGHADAVERVTAEIGAEHPDVLRSLTTVQAHRKTSHVAAVQTVFGSPCYNPGSFQGALHAFQTSENFTEAVRQTIRAGGCNCSRSLFIGALAGAQHGLAAIPVEWLEQTTEAEAVFKQALAAMA